MHYLGQTHTVAVPLPVALQDDSHRRYSEAIGRDAFETAYAASFSRLLPGLPIRIVSLRSRGDRPPPGVRLLGVRAGRRRHGRKGETGYAPGVVRRRLARHRGYGRGSICRSAPIVEAPAILEQPDATTVHRTGPARPGRQTGQSDR